MPGHPVASVTRAVFPGRAVLLGKDIAGRILVGIPVQPRSVCSWVRGNGGQSELDRVRRAYDETR